MALFVTNVSIDCCPEADAAAAYDVAGHDAMWRFSVDVPVVLLLWRSTALHLLHWAKSNALSSLSNTNLKYCHAFAFPPSLVARVYSPEAILCLIEFAISHPSFYFFLCLSFTL